MHVPKGTYKIYSHLKQDSKKQNKLNQSNQQNYHTKYMGVYEEGDEHICITKTSKSHYCRENTASFERSFYLEIYIAFKSFAIFINILCGIKIRKYC